MSNQSYLDAALRKDLKTFSVKVFQTLNPGSPFEQNWHIDAVIHNLEKARTGQEKRLIINVPPRSLKSVLASVALPALLLGHNPGARLICVSYAQPLAAKHLRDFRRILESDWYRRIFPKTIISKDTEEIIETTAGGARLSTSVGAVVTGFGGGTIIIDDPMKPDDAPSQAARDRVIRYYSDTLFSRLDSKVDDVIIVVMQRLHEDDLAGHLLRKGGWTHLCFPAIATEDAIIELGKGNTHTRRIGDVLHPAREPQYILDEIRRNLGSTAFEAQYQQAPVPETGNMVKREWLQTYRAPLDRSGMRIFQSWDTALKGDPSVDYSACTTWAERNGQHYLLDVFRKKLDFPGLIKDAVSLYQQYRPDALLIEDQGSGTSLIQLLRAQYQIYAVGRRSKDDKKTRLATVSHFFEAGRVLFPHDAPWLADMENELLGFPSGRYDDQVDSLSQYLGWARDRGSSIFNVDWGAPESLPTHDGVADALLSLRRFRC